MDKTSPQRRYTKVGQRGSGHLAVSCASEVAGLIKPAQRQSWTGDEAGGKPGRDGAYTNQRFNLSQPGKAHGRKPRFQTGPGKSGRPGLWGGFGKRSHGGNVRPSCNRKSRNGNPPPKAGRARLLSQWARRLRRGCALGQPQRSKTVSSVGCLSVPGLGNRAPRSR
jgi:hypothetical protein